VVPVKWTDPCAVTLGISTKMLRDLLHTLVLVTIFDSLEKNVFLTAGWVWLVDPQKMERAKAPFWASTSKLLTLL
jgi:hypothetical protein